MGNRRFDFYTNYYFYNTKCSFEAKRFQRYMVIKDSRTFIEKMRYQPCAKAKV
jgi:hypothetical protein